MSLLSRGTRAAARPLQQSLNRQSRRCASDHHGDGHSHGSSESALHVDSGATGHESFGKGFYIALAAVPLAYTAYSVSTTEDNFIKRTYRDYWSKVDKEGRQDVLHAAALEQAISDRAIMLSEARTATRDIRYPEFFNQGSPWNVVAGEGTADLRKLEAFYQEQRKQLFEETEAKSSARKNS